MVVEPGRRLRQYEIIRELGRGGMGIVYLARDMRLGRRVANQVCWARPRTPDSDEGLPARGARHRELRAREHRVIARGGRARRDALYGARAPRGERLRETTGTGEAGAGRAVKGLMVPASARWSRAHERGIRAPQSKPENVFVRPAAAPSRCSTSGSRLLADGKGRDGHARGPAWPARWPTWRPSSSRRGGRPAVRSLGGGDHALRAAGRAPSRAAADAGGAAATPTSRRPLPRIRDEMPDLPHCLTIVDRCLEKRKERRFSTARELLAELELLLPGRLRADAGAGPYPASARFRRATPIVSSAAAPTCCRW